MSAAKKKARRVHVVTTSKNTKAISGMIKAIERAMVSGRDICLTITREPDRVDLVIGSQARDYSAIADVLRSIAMGKAGDK